MAAIHAIHWGKTRIPFSLVRTSRQKTVAIRVEPDGEVQVLAPMNADPERIDAIVRKRAAWIVERKRRVADVPPTPTPRQFVTGEGYLYLGRQARLRIGIGSEVGVKLASGWLVVTVPRGTRSDARAGVVRDMLVGWYRERATERLPERVEAWSLVIGAVPKAVLVREPKQRWGSCDAAGNVRFNWRIIQAPRKLVDYVVAHELVHLLHDDHGRAFWAKLGHVMPDYEERRDALRRRGGELAW